jgi:hypothetical protein
MLRNALIPFLLAAAAPAQDSSASPRDEILAAAELPRKAQALRDKGVDRAEVRKAIEATKERRLEARERRELLEAAARAVDEHGPVDNFGAFVRTQLDKGLRGRELAAAIRAEHQARGKGKGHAKKPAEVGKPDDKGGERGGKSKDDDALDDSGGKRGGKSKDDETSDDKSGGKGGRGGKGGGR